MRSSAVSWNEAVTGSGKTSNKIELVVVAGMGSGFCWSHSLRQSLDVLPAIVPGMKCLPRRAIHPSSRSIHLPSRIYSLRTLQLFLKCPPPQKWQWRSREGKAYSNYLGYPSWRLPASWRLTEWWSLPSLLQVPPLLPHWRFGQLVTDHHTPRRTMWCHEERNTQHCGFPPEYKGRRENDQGV